MTNERIRKLTDEDLLQACRAKADAGSTFVDTNLAEERRKVTEYYMGKRPLQSREGGSKFVSQDVYLSVETMKSEIVEIRSEEHTSELQPLMRNTYDVYCLNKN